MKYLLVFTLSTFCSINMVCGQILSDPRDAMIQFPEKYSKQVELDLIRACESYANTYETKLRLLTSQQGITLPELISLFGVIQSFFEEIKGHILQYKEAMIDKYLIKPYRFRMWDEIEEMSN